MDDHLQKVKELSIHLLAIGELISDKDFILRHRGVRLKVQIFH